MYIFCDGSWSKGCISTWVVLCIYTCVFCVFQVLAGVVGVTGVAGVASVAGLTNRKYGHCPSMYIM